jgi:hypothetical protein
MEYELGGKRPKHNVALKRDIQEVLRHHKVKGIRMHMAHMAGSGLFDTLMNMGKKVVDFGKKAYNAYQTHKDTIHKVADFGMKHAPTALEMIRRVRGGKRIAGARPSGGKRTLPPALKQWQEECKRYAKKHGVTYREAMSALKRH